VSQTLHEDIQSDLPVAGASCLELILTTMAGVRRETATRIGGRVADMGFLWEPALPQSRSDTERELYERVIRPIVHGEWDDQLARIASAFGWRGITQELSDIDPDFWTMVNLWPPRDAVLAATLLDLDLPALERASEGRRSPPVLDIGCGFGLLERILRLSGFSFPVFGIDVGERWLDAARVSAIADFEVASIDAAELDAEEEFSAAFGAFVHHHVDHFERSLACLWRALKPGSPFSFTDVSGVPDVQGHVRAIGTDASPTIVRLQTGAEVEVVWRFNGREAHVKAHPDAILEFIRPVEENIRHLTTAGFEVSNACWLDTKTLHVLCRKPHRPFRAEETCGKVSRQA
jgi:SAM-dependent methyltransferase